MVPNCMLGKTLRFMFTEYFTVSYVFCWYCRIFFFYRGVDCYSSDKVLIMVYRMRCVYCSG